MGRKGYTQEEIKQKALRFKKYIDETNKIPTKDEFLKLRSELDLPSFNTFVKYYGSYNKLIESLGFESITKRRGKQGYTKEEMDHKAFTLKKYIEETNKVPTSEEFSNLRLKLDLPSVNTLVRHFGSYNKFIEFLGYNPKVKRYKKEQIEKKALEFKKYIEETGRVPTKREFPKLRLGLDLPSLNTFVNYYGTYNKFIESLGFDPNTKRYTKEELLKILKNYKKETRKTPANREFSKDPLLPSPLTYAIHFGSWNNALLEAGMQLSHTFHEYDNLLIAYRNDKKGKISDKTIAKYTSTIADLCNFLKSKEKTWKNLDSEIIIEYFKYLKKYGSFSNCTRQTKPNSPVSIKDKAISISAFLTWVEKWHIRKKGMEWCKKNKIHSPIIDTAIVLEIKETLKLPQVVPQLPETKPRALTREEIKQIRKVINNPIEKNIFDLGLNLGLRVSEYKKITMDMVLGKPDEMENKQNGNEPIPRFDREHYIEVKGKRDKIRFVVLTNEMKALVRQQLLLRKIHRVEHDGFFFALGKVKKVKLHPWIIHQIYSKLRENSGVYFTAHCLRHSMSEFFQELGVKQNLVAQRMGHLGTLTQRYSRAKIIKRYKIFQEKIGLL
ncbi:homing endonuclease associated repeat-containing protein [Candidatus Borrarchaeum sp.]|uniref:homing endonuclease associated repeat-containing protein n=1 Tax=Candidatus Borrarchaeum sp. TaxID=2846742 RepID=UPI002580B124|nr:tyrosine-type recombinase/integrase [Candidatus Borrarchaeum sp.]